MVQVYSNSALAVTNSNIIQSWLEVEKNRLVGSAVFTKNDSITSKMVRWAEGWKCKDECFIPSHTGSIIKYNNDLYIFDMKPMKASVQPLYSYLCNTKDEYRIILRDFELNTEMFSINIAEHIGEFYPFLSAIRSVLTKRQSKWRRHCSELHLRELQKQGLFTNLNPEITPDELYHALIGGGNDVSSFTS